MPQRGGGATPVPSKNVSREHSPTFFYGTGVASSMMQCNRCNDCVTLKYVVVTKGVSCPGSKHSLLYYGTTKETQGDNSQSTKGTTKVRLQVQKTKFVRASGAHQFKKGSMNKLSRAFNLRPAVPAVQLSHAVPAQTSTCLQASWLAACTGPKAPRLARANTTNPLLYKSQNQSYSCASALLAAALPVHPPQALRTA